ncbi:cytochrome D1 domain-containing protein [Novosphingobium sp.]|uniref:YncE family protein n=1 Tax=Novosphingobium sp. TaxID=1874826 RepID=UPI00286E92FB|nr:cytochrome D1 domain-containing protein [Novosphingobium sp.]
MRLRNLVSSLLFAAIVSGPASADVLIVGNKGEDTVSFISLKSGKLCARVSTGKAPHEIAISPDGRQAAVVAYGGTSIDLFNIREQRLVRRIDLAPNAGPHGIAWISAGRIAVTFDRSNSVALIDPRDLSFTSVATGQRGSHMLAVSPDGRRAHVANILSGSVTVIDLDRMVKLRDIATGGNPEAIAITRDGKDLWVGDHSGPRVRVIDLATGKLAATLPTDPFAIRLAMTPDGKTAVASNFQSGTLSLFDVRSRRPLRTIKLSGSAKAMQVTIAISNNSRLAYVAETGSDQIAEVDLRAGKVLRRIPTGRGGDGLAVIKGNCSVPDREP